MKYLFAALACFSLVSTAVSSTLTDTTTFWSKAANDTFNFQAYSGYENIDWYYDKGTAAMYYSLWQGNKLPWTDKSVPLIIWLQGGPGGSSQFGCFNELGPLALSKGTKKPVPNPWAWNSFGHLLCPDQPIGVGFSYNKNDKKVDNTPQAADHFMNFLSNFFKNNPSLGLGTNPLYLSGESYAGHYIPAFAERILTNTSLGFNLKGILLGDGYVDPLYQINNYESFLSSVGVVSSEWRDTTAFMQNQALVRILRADYKQASNYTNFIIADDSVSAKYYNGMNVLNYKQYDEGNINPDYDKFLEANKLSFGVDASVKFVSDNQEMYYAFCDDLSRSFKKSLQTVLQKGIRSLIYNGQNDFIVNTAGVLNYLNTLEWTYAQAWKSRQKITWKESSGNSLGWYKNYRNLILVVVRDAGHLLPSDQPRSAWYMLNNYFTNNLW